MASPQAKATVIGFSRENCPKCFGRGRAGWDRKFNDQAHIIPCDCVEFLDLETVQKSWQEQQEKLKKALDDQIRQQIADAPIVEIEYECGLHAIVNAGMREEDVVCPTHGESCGHKFLSSSAEQASPETQSSSSQSSEA